MSGYRHFLKIQRIEKEAYELDGVLFLGGTLWTDMNNHDSLTLYHMKGMMNDFRCVTNSNKQGVVFKGGHTNEAGQFVEDPWGTHIRPARFTPEDAVEDHHKMRDYIEAMIEGKFDQKFVVVGHHAPSKTSTHPRYANEVVMNGGYSSALDEFIMDHPQIKLWTHGHTHEDFDYMIGSTRIVCNPRGYDAYEDRADRFQLKFVEV